MKKLEEGELRTALEAAPGWSMTGGKLVRVYTFPDFAAAMRFVQQVALLAEQANHHPDIDIRYNRVTLGLVTHDAGGITATDARMAAQLNREIET